MFISRSEIQSLIQSATQFIKKQELQKAKKALQEAQLLLQKVVPMDLEHKKLQIETYYQFEVIYDQQEAVIQCLEFACKRWALTKEVFGEKSEESLNNINDFTYYFNKEGNYRKALKSSNLSLQYIQPTTLPELHIEVLLNRATIFRSTGDFDYALGLHYKIEGLLQQIPDNMALKQAQINNHALCYHLKGNHEKALQEYQKLVSILGVKNPYITHTYNNIAACHNRLNQPQKAIKYYQKVLQINSLYPLPHPIILHALSNMGQCYVGMDDLKKAQEYTQEAKEYYENKKLNDKQSKLTIYLNLSEFYLKSKKYKEALYTVLKIHASKTKEDIQQIQKQYLPTHSINFFYQKSRIYHRIAQTQNTEKLHLQNALKSIQIAIKILIELRQSYKVEESKLVLADHFKRVFEQALNINVDLLNSSTILPIERTQLQQKTFNYLEQSKSILLYTNLKDAEAKIAANIPTELLKQEKELQIELTYLEKSIQKEQAKGDKKDERFLIEQQAQLFDHKQQYDELIKTFEEKYTQYYQLKYNLQTVGTKKLQNHLSPKTAILNYFVGEKYLFISFLSREKLEVVRAKKPPKFEPIIQKFKKRLSSYPLESKRYARDAHQLYQYLIEPIEVHLKEMNQLIIIPDEVLNYLPFEVLLTDKIVESVHHKDLPYLLQKYTISYHYSATLYHRSSKQKSNNSQTTHHFLGIAPIYVQQDEKQQLKGKYDEQTMRDVKIGDTTYPALLESEKEVQSIVHQFQKLQFSTQTLLHEKATIEDVQKAVKKYQYVLIAAHGHYNDDYPELSGIIFSPNSTKTGIGEKKTNSEDKGALFYTADAYHLSLQADLVVLSCCESGIGKLAKGEGMMAINRGFLYAGAKNVIYTVFKIYDKQSNELTQALFKYILEGQSYSEALRSAKLEMIHEKGYAPVYWAGYVLLGT